MQLVPKKGFPPYLLTVVLHFEAGALFVILSQAPNLKMLGLLQVKQWVQVPVQKDEIVYFFFPSASSRRSVTCMIFYKWEFLMLKQSVWNF